jgi:hypothetical protein
VLCLAVLTEAPTDDAVAFEIVAALRAEPIRLVEEIAPRVRGWPGVQNQLPGFIRRLYYHTEADALAVLVDADLTVVHSAGHTADAPVRDCRLCELQVVARESLARLAPVSGRRPLRIAIGVPVPALEAWLLAGRDGRASEAAWAQARGDRRYWHLKGALKDAAYGGRHLAEVVMAERARTLIRITLRDGDVLRQSFPGGFGPFADAIVGW